MRGGVIAASIVLLLASGMASADDPPVPGAAPDAPTAEPSASLPPSGADAPAVPSLGDEPGNQVPIGLPDPKAPEPKRQEPPAQGDGRGSAPPSEPSSPGDRGLPARLRAIVPASALPLPGFPATRLIDVVDLVLGKEPQTPPQDAPGPAHAAPAVITPASISTPPTTNPGAAWMAMGGAAIALSVAGASSGAPAGGLLRRIVARLLGPGLFTRVTQEKVLDHKRRRDLVDFVRENPGERLTVARDRLGLANGAMLHHLGMLEQRGIVRVVREEGMSRLYPGGPRVVARPYIAPQRQGVLQLLRSKPGLSQRELAANLGMSDRVASYHVRWLHTHALVRVEREAGAHRCYALDPQPAPPAQMPQLA